MDAINDIFRMLLTDAKLVALGVSVFFIAWGGFLYATSAGSPHQMEKAKTTILYAIVGLCIVFLATTIGTAIKNALPG